MLGAKKRVGELEGKMGGLNDVIRDLEAKRESATDQKGFLEFDNKIKATWK